MAKKLVGKWSKGSATTKAYWSYEDQEYTVRLWCGETEREDAVYFTNDAADAIGTAQAMLSHNDCESALGCGCAGRK